MRLCIQHIKQATQRHMQSTVNCRSQLVKTLEPGNTDKAIVKYENNNSTHYAGKEVLEPIQKYCRQKTTGNL